MNWKTRADYSYLEKRKGDNFGLDRQEQITLFWSVNLFMCDSRLKGWMLYGKSEKYHLPWGTSWLLVQLYSLFYGLENVNGLE